MKMIFFIPSTYRNSIFSEIVIEDLQHQIMVFWGGDTMYYKNYALKKHVLHWLGNHGASLSTNTSHI